MTTPHCSMPCVSVSISPAPRGAATRGSAVPAPSCSTVAGPWPASSSRWRPRAEGSPRRRSRGRRPTAPCATSVPRTRRPPVRLLHTWTDLLGRRGGREDAAGWPSAVTGDVRPEAGPPALTAEAVRERMSGNLCRCGAYVTIVQAVARASEVSAWRRRREGVRIPARTRRPRRPRPARHRPGRPPPRPRHQPRRPDEGRCGTARPARRRLASIRQHGLSVNSPTVNGVRTIAAPIFVGDKISGTLAIVGTTAAVPDDVESPMAQALLETARALSQRLGSSDDAPIAD